MGAILGSLVVEHAPGDNTGVGTVDMQVDKDGTVIHTKVTLDSAQILFTNLPTADPLIAGRLYLASNAIKVSTGS